MKGEIQMSSAWGGGILDIGVLTGEVAMNKGNQTQRNTNPRMHYEYISIQSQE